MNHVLKAIYLHMTYEIHADREAIFEPSLQAVAPAYITTGRGFQFIMLEESHQNKENHNQYIHPNLHAIYIGIPKQMLHIIG